MFKIRLRDPVKFQNELYGKEALFNEEKKTIKLTSEFHESAIIQYNQIESLSIIPFNRKKWLIIATILTIFVIGVPLIFGVLYLPPWKIQVFLKNQSPKTKPILIRAQLGIIEAKELYQFLKPDINVTITIPKKYQESSIGEN